jgi:hypothetical protein
MARRKLWFGIGGVSGLSMTEQAQLWRAAARGARANGDKAGEARYAAQARQIERTRSLSFDTSPS